MTSPGSPAAQQSLICCLERYERAERLAAWFPEITDLGQEADKRHDALLKAALNCGFEPGRRHTTETTLEWSRRRAALIRRVMPKHAHEAQRRAA